MERTDSHIFPAERLWASEPPSFLAASWRRAIETQQRLAAGPAMKVLVRQGGYYRVTGADLVAAGADASLLAADRRNLQLWVSGRETAIAVRATERAGDDGRLGPEDAIEFYGTGVETQWTGERVYWLVAGSGAGKRVSREPAGASTAAPAHFGVTLERRDRSLYFAALLNGDDQNFFGSVVGTTPLAQAFAVRHLAAGPLEARLEVALQGLTFAPHSVTVSMAGRSLGTIAFDNRGSGRATFVIPAGALAEGSNAVMLQAQGGDTDKTLVDFIRLTYRASRTADDGVLLFDAPADTSMVVDGFTTSDVRVLDVTDPLDVREVASTTTAATAGGFTANVTLPGPASMTMSLSTEDRRLIAVSGSGVRAPQGLVPNGPSSWHRPRSDAELVIISHPSLLPEAAPLVARRQAEGWKVAVVSVDDLYDEFTYGEKDPAAIRTFLSHARTTWPAPPKAVLLLGDATFDPRNFLAKGSFDLVPTKLIDTDDLETSSDDWFVDWNGDHEPDLPIGRLPVRTPEEARLVIGRIVAFEPKAATALGDSRILFLGDYDPQPALDFPTGIRDIRTSLPPALQVTEVLRSALGDAAARQSLSDGLAASPFLFNYVGHGTTEMWGGSWLSSKAVMTMWSPRPVALMMATTCLNGFFHDVYTRSMAEALLTMPGGGAVASIGSSSLAELPDQVLLTEAVYRLSLGEGRPLGEALQLAKRGLRDHEVQRTYMLFGDPAAVLVAPAAKIAALAVEPEAGLPGGCSIARPAPDPGHAIGSGILLAALALVRRFGRRGAGASRPPRRWRSGVGAPPR